MVIAVMAPVTGFWWDSAQACALYTGPSPSAICSCSRKKFASRKRPCLNFQMGRCLGACAGKVAREDYLPVVDNAIRYTPPGGRIAIGWRVAKAARSQLPPPRTPLPGWPGA